MTKKNKLAHLAISAFALTAAQAHAQSIVGNIANTGTTGVANGGNTCADGVTTGGYTTVDGTTYLGDVTVSGSQVAQTLCGDYDATTTYATNASGATSYGGDAATYYVNAAAVATFEYAVELTDVYDTSTLPATYQYSSGAQGSLSDAAVGNYYHYAGTSTDQQYLHNDYIYTYGTGDTGYGYAVNDTVSAGYTSRSVTYGTSSFDATTGDVTFTPDYTYSSSDSATGGYYSYNDGTFTANSNQSAFGFSASQYDTSTGVSSFATLGSGGMFAYYDDGAGNYAYNSVGAGGMSLYDSASGNYASYGMGGVYTNTGSYTVSSGGPSYLNVGTESVTIHGGSASTTAVWDNSGYTQTDSTNGVTFTVDNAGNMANLGNSTVGGNLQVNGNANISGLTTTNGISNTGTITSSGNITSSGTVTGATLVSAGATAVGTNLTVGGTAAIAGNASVGGNLAVVGSYSTTAGNIVTGTGQVWAGNIRINNSGRISGLANATLSGTSTEAVTGQQLFATNNALAALDAREASNFNLLSRRSDKAYQGVAMGFAMNAAPLNLDDGQGGVSGGVGTFEGQWAGAIRAQYVTKSGVGFGANVGFAQDSVGGAVGASIRF